jgi:hypothetical protein
MTKSPSKHEAKKLLREKMSEMGLKEHRLTARTVNVDITHSAWAWLQDPESSGMNNFLSQPLVFVTVHDWSTDLRKEPSSRSLYERLEDRRAKRTELRKFAEGHKFATQFGA